MSRTGAGSATETLNWYLTQHSIYVSCGSLTFADLQVKCGEASATQLPGTLAGMVAEISFLLTLRDDLGLQIPICRFRHGRSEPTTPVHNRRLHRLCRAFIADNVQANINATGTDCTSPRHCKSRNSDAVQ